MPTSLDHLIVRVKDLDETVAFWTRYLGLSDEGRREPFAVLRVSEGLLIQLAPWGTEGDEHFAFEMSPEEFDATFELLKREGVDYGDSFDAVGNLRGPGEASGARGLGRALYFFDPNHHLLEIRSYS